MDWFKDIGLSDKQTRLYMFLLENSAKTASEMARALGEQRTNVYVLVDELEQKGLVQRDQSAPVVRFVAANPTQVQRLLQQEQKRLADQAIQLRKAMPELLGLHQLASPKSGIAYFEGLKGYAAALDDQIRPNHKEVCVFGATELEENRSDAWEILIEKLQKRGRAGIKTRIIFEEALRTSTTLSSDYSALLRRTMKTRFWGVSPFEGEIAIYGDTVVLTSYDEKLVSLVVRNKQIAATFQAIFDQAWHSAKS